MAVTNCDKKIVKMKAEQRPVFCYCRATWESSRRFMMQCDACKEWFHGDCLTPTISQEQSIAFAKFHCPECTVLSGPSILRPPQQPRPQRETRTMIDYNEAASLAEDEHKYAKLLRAKRFAPNKFAYVDGDMVTMDWVRRTGLREPFLVQNPDGLDMKMPPSSLTVDQVADACGRDKIVEAMEVLTQQDKQMTLDEWAQYFTQPMEKRKRLLNVISLEIGSTKLAQMIVRPRIVRELDWTETVWPPREVRPEYPRVQLYCLMSVKDCYTDFHVDFGGSSVFYHLLSGEKVFYFVRPTPVNMKKYEKWSSSPDQSKIFFGDEVKECVEVRITSGNTMIIPTGWIHAVYTPKDSIVIGGNFLQGMNIGGQLDCYDVENRTDIPLKFRYPYFVQMQWYACKSYLAQLRTPQHALSKWEVEGLRRLADFLGAEVKRLRDTKADAKERRRVRANVPAEIKNVAKMVACFRDLVVREQMKLATGELTQTFVEGFGYGVADGVTEEETDVFDDDEDAENEEGPRGEGGEVGERFPALGGKSIKLKLKLQPNFEEFEEDLKDAGDVVDWKSDESEAENFEDIDDEDDEDFDSGDEELDDDDVDASDIDDLDDQDERNQKRKRDRKNAVAPKTVLSAGVPIASPSSSFPISWTAGPCAAIVSNGSLSVSMPPPHAELSSRAPSAPVQVKNKLAPQPSEATKQMLASIKAAAAAPPPKKKKKSVLASLLKKR